MDEDLSSLTQDLLTATESLAETLLHAEPILAFRVARSRYQASPGARKLMQDLAQAQAELRRCQAQNTITRELMERVQTLRKHVAATSVVMDYLYAERVALAYLPSVNQQISELLGVDYASLAGRSAC